MNLRATIKHWQPEEVRGAKFAFLFHAPEERHIREAFDIRGGLTDKVKQSLKEYPPFIPAPIYQDRVVYGINVALPWTPEMMMDIRGFRRKAIEALDFIHSCGVKYVGLGALIPSFLSNGRSIANVRPDVCITTGHGATTLMVSKILDNVIEEFDLNVKEITVAVVGAAGSMGRTVFSILTKTGVQNLLLVEKRGRLAKLRKEVVDQYFSQGGRARIEVISDRELDKLSNTDLVVVVSSAHQSFLEVGHLSNALAVVDDAKPSGVSKETIKQLRGHTLVLECLAEAPFGFDFGYDFGFTQPHYCYSCAMEALAVAEKKVKGNFVVGFPKPSQIIKLEEWFQGLGIKAAPFTESGGRPVTSAEITSVRSRWQELAHHKQEPMTSLSLASM